MNPNEIRSRLETNRKLIRQFELIIELEEAEDIAAVNALLKIWDPGLQSRAHQQGVSLLERTQKELKLMREYLLELEFDLWLEDVSNWQRWEIVLRIDPDESQNALIAYESSLRNMVADRFMFVADAFEYKQIWEYLDFRARQAIKELNDAK